MVNKLLVAFLGLMTLLVAEVGSAKKSPEKVKLKMVTSMGDIVIELDQKKAPKTVKNFLDYAESGHYDGTIFHRVIGGFMIQGGGFTKDMTQKKTKAPVENEGKNGLKNSRGTLAMARTMDVNSATAQFFINHKDNVFLDTAGEKLGYAVFGKVIEGMDVVDKIAGVETGTEKQFRDVPKKPILINSVKKI